MRIKGWEKTFEAEDIFVAARITKEKKLPIIWEHFAKKKKGKWAGKHAKVRVYKSLAVHRLSWVVEINDNIIARFKTEEKATKYAVSWMRRHPRG